MQGAAYREVVLKLLAQYSQPFAAFINTHVIRLLQQGAKAIQHAYRTKARTIAEHDAKLAQAREAARRNPTPSNNGLVRYYEKELERLRTEHSILREATELMGIAVP